MPPLPALTPEPFLWVFSTGSLERYHQEKAPPRAEEGLSNFGLDAIPPKQTKAHNLLNEEV
jgi:hypothetical protein